MRDIARNFQALPLVSWIWTAMAIIAAPVMALPAEVAPEPAESEVIASLNADAAPDAEILDTEVQSIDLVESAALEDTEAAELVEPEVKEDTEAAELVGPDPKSEAAELVEPELESDEAAIETDWSSILLVQANSDELAEPSDPFFFDENSIGLPEDGVLVPVPTSEPIDGEIGSSDAELDDGPLTPPSLKLQTAIIQEGNDFSARARVFGHYFFESNLAVIGAVDLSTGDAFSDTDSTGFNVSELFVVASPPNLPGLRGAAGLIELTSFFDRNSFAKDSLTHFINPVFQTNPALATTQLESQPAALVQWRPIDEIILKAVTFSSGGFDDFNFDAVAGELGLNLGNFIVRGTYVSATDDGDLDGPLESFQVARDGIFGPQEGDREVAVGVNAEWFIPQLNAGLFGRYGLQDNRDLDVTGETFSFGVNFLDLFIDDDRFGVGYGRQLSDDDLREGDIPDVLEVFYDVRLAPNVRAAVDWQIRDEFSESLFGFRIRAEFDLLDLF